MPSDGLSGRAPEPSKAEREASGVAACFAAIAEEIRRGVSAARVTAAIDAAQHACLGALGSGSGGELAEALANLQTVLKTWAEVWPRLGAQTEFRAAVIREAELWARRLPALGGPAKRAA